MRTIENRRRAPWGAVALWLAVGLAAATASCDSQQEGSTDVGTAGDAASCPEEPVPAGAASCPAECTGGCDEDQVCTVDCAGIKACEGETISCPVGFTCHVVCQGLDACDDNNIHCAAGHACTLSCEEKDACGDLTLHCADGPCTIECGTHAAACEGAVMRCATGSCQALCAGESKPRVSGCEDACFCSGC